MDERLLHCLKRVVAGVVEGGAYFDTYGLEGFYMRFLILLNSIQSYYNQELPEQRSAILHQIRELLALHHTASVNDPVVKSLIYAMRRDVAASRPDGAIRRFGWKHEEVSSRTRRIPTMLSAETMSYYKWLTRTFRGTGEIVELGCWMGCSTACLAEGLLQNPSMHGAKIHVFDSFVWLDWMKNFAVESFILKSNLQTGASFLDYFWKNCEPYREILMVYRASLDAEKDEFGVPPASWPQAKIGILIMDVADEREANEVMWRIFSRGFVADITVIVFNQYGNARALGVREFCRAHSTELLPIHKPCSSAKAFLYKGKMSPAVRRQPKTPSRH